MAYENRDYTHLSEIEKQNIDLIAQAIRNKAYGVDVRESIALAIEWVNREYKSTIVDNLLTRKHFEFSKNKVSEIELSLDDFLERYDSQIANNTDLDEVIDARGEFTTVNNRFSDVENKVERVANRTTVQPSFTVIDDDASYGALTILKPMLDARGFKGSTAVPTANVSETSGRTLSLNQIKSLHDAGWSILSHTHTHTQLGALDEETMRYELSESKKKLKEWGMPTEHIVLPANNFSQKVADIGREYYTSLIGAYTQGSEGLHTNLHPLPTLRINRVGIGAFGSYRSLADWEQVKKEIDYNVEHGGLVVLMTHVTDNTVEDNELLEMTLDYIKTLGYTVEAYDSAFEKHKNVIEKGHFDGETHRFEYSLGVDGVVDSGGIRTHYLKPDEVNASYPPNYYDKDSEYYCQLTPNVEASKLGIPYDLDGVLGSDLYGILYTNTLRAGSDGYVRQYFYPKFEESVYFRKSKNVQNWGEWLVESTQIASRPEMDADPSVYTKGVTTFSYPTNESVTGGTLTTFKPKKSDDVYTYQIFKLVGDDALRYRRWSTTRVSWDPWIEPLTRKVVEKLPFDAPAESYNIGETRDVYTVADVREKSSPNVIGGVLTTVKPSSDLFYAYQTFKERGSNRFYLRSYIKPSPDPGIWSEWKEV